MRGDMSWRRVRLWAAASALALAAACATPLTPEQIEAQAWSQALKYDSPAGYEAYLRQYAGSPRAQEAQERVIALMAAEAEAWARAAQLDNEYSYGSYLEQYPWGANADVAQRRFGVLAAPRLRAEERAAWEYAERNNSIGA
jgi:hypothetical protein